MVCMKKAIILLFLLLYFLIRPAGAASYPDNIDDIKKEYPTESFLIGIGNALLLNRRLSLESLNWKIQQGDDCMAQAFNKRGRAGSPAR